MFPSNRIVGCWQDSAAKRSKVSGSSFPCPEEGVEVVSSDTAESLTELKRQLAREKEGKNEALAELTRQLASLKEEKDLAITNLKRQLKMQALEKVANMVGGGERGGENGEEVQQDIKIESLIGSISEVAEEAEVELQLL